MKKFISSLLIISPFIFGMNVNIPHQIPLQHLAMLAFLHQDNYQIELKSTKTAKRSYLQKSKTKTTNPSFNSKHLFIKNYR